MQLTTEPFLQPNVSILLHFIYWIKSILCMCVFICVLRPEINLGCSTQELSTLFSEIETPRYLEFNDSAS